MKQQIKYIVQTEQNVKMLNYTILQHMVIIIWNVLEIVQNMFGIIKMKIITVQIKQLVISMMNNLNIWIKEILLKNVLKHVNISIMKMNIMVDKDVLNMKIVMIWWVLEENSIYGKIISVLKIVVIVIIIWKLDKFIFALENKVVLLLI